MTVLSPTPSPPPPASQVVSSISPDVKEVKEAPFRLTGTRNETKVKCFLVKSSSFLMYLCYKVVGNLDWHMIFLVIVKGSFSKKRSTASSRFFCLHFFEMFISQFFHKEGVVLVKAVIWICWVLVSFAFCFFGKKKHLNKIIQSALWGSIKPCVLWELFSCRSKWTGCDSV